MRDFNEIKAALDELLRRRELVAKAEALSWPGVKRYADAYDDGYVMFEGILRDMVTTAKLLSDTVDRCKDTLTTIDSLAADRAEGYRGLTHAGEVLRAALLDVREGHHWSCELYVNHAASAVDENTGTVLHTAGVFSVFRPTRIEYVVRGTETEEELDALEAVECGVSGRLRLPLAP